MSENARDPQDPNAVPAEDISGEDAPGTYLAADGHHYADTPENRLAFPADESDDSTNQ